MKASFESEFISIMTLSITSNTIINFKDTTLIYVGASVRIQNPLSSLNLYNKHHFCFSIRIQKLIKLKGKKNSKLKCKEIRKNKKATLLLLVFLK